LIIIHFSPIRASRKLIYLKNKVHILLHAPPPIRGMDLGEGLTNGRKNKFYKTSYKNITLDKKRNSDEFAITIPIRLLINRLFGGCRLK
jgi:hypothetical protein